jgi:uncharacterized protein YndB with AHSA1/START domain
MNTEISGETTFAIPEGRPEVLITRVFDAPRELVFRVITDPEQTPNWWSPRKYPIQVDEMDVRPGGKWRYVSAAGNEDKHGFHGFYHDVTAPERLVFTFEYEGVPGHVLMETIRLEDLGDGRTKLVDSSVYQTQEDRDGMVAAGMEWGARQAIAQLAELLAKLK